MEWQLEAYTLTDETARLDLATVVTLLRSTYWAAERPVEVTERSLRHSLNFGLFHGSQQVGFARVVTDRATVAYLCDVVIADTAGRLATQLHLMDELSKVKRVIGKAMEGAPHEVLLVVDGNTGQNALSQVKAFDQALGLTGVIITKLDGTAKGGVLAAIALWMAINHARAQPFDPYPYILLNLVLSCLAALQAPIIMMSQNRQADRDRQDAQNDYEVNMKAELEIVALHAKLDEHRALLETLLAERARWVIGTHINVYSAPALAEYTALGAVRWLPPVELALEAMAQ